MLRRLLVCLLLANLSNAQSYTKIEVWENNAWSNVSLQTFEYGGSGTLMTESLQMWNGSAWSNNQRILYSYPWLQTVALSQNWNASDQIWVDESRSTKTTAGDITTITEIWQDAWVNDQKVVQTISPSIETHSYWDSDQWNNSHRVLYNFYPNNGGNETVNQSWDGQAWINSSRHEIVYNYDTVTNDLLSTEILDQTWDNGWENLSRYVTDAMVDNEEYTTHYSWDGNDWAVVGRAIRTVDGDNQHTLYEAYDAGSGLWIPDNQNFVEVDWNNSLTVRTYQLYADGWENFYRVTEYNAPLLGVEKKKIEISVYPNPSQETVNIKASEPVTAYELFGLDGKIIAIGTPNDDSFSVDVSGLSRGVYLLKTGGTVTRILKR